MIFQTDRPIYQICAVILLFAFGLWLTQDLIFPQRLLAQSSASEYLQKGKTHWENLEVEEAVTALEQAIRMNLPRKTDLIEARKILAFCWATKREPQKAEAEFKTILEIDPGFRLSEDESPIFLEPFRQAMKEVKQKDNEPPEIEHRPVSKIDEGESLVITALITDQTQIQRALVYFKSRSDSKYRTLNMPEIQKNTYQVEFSANTLDPPELAYYIVAKDGEGNSGMWRNADNPFKVKITPVEKEEPPPTVAKIPEPQKEKPKPKKKKGSPILWIVLGAAVIGGGAVALAGGGGEKEGGGGEQNGGILIDPPDWPEN